MNGRNEILFVEIKEGYEDRSIIEVGFTREGIMIFSAQTDCDNAGLGGRYGMELLVHRLLH
jgi:hypothetical protein